MVKPSLPPEQSLVAELLVAAIMGVVFYFGSKLIYPYVAHTINILLPEPFNTADNA